MDRQKLEALLGYILAVAGENDAPFERDLGPIHLIKYAYLADLFFAERHDGQTFTGTDWQFYHFGPWSLDVFQAIAPTMETLRASERRFESRDGEREGVRWTLRDDALSRSQGGLPAPVALRLRRVVREYGHDTWGLLHHVYLTPPMLQAAPGEKLDFGAAVPAGRVPARPVAAKEALSAKEQKRQDSQREALRERLRARLRETRAAEQFVEPDPPPPYDDLWDQGVAWLDSLGGEPPPPGQGKLVIDDSVWKSEWRRDSELP